MKSRDKFNEPSSEQNFEALVEAGTAFRHAANALNEAQQTRDAAIIVSSAQGVSRRKVAAAAGVTVGRVQQVVSETSHLRQGLADRLIQIAVDRLPVDDRKRYFEEWSAELDAIQSPLTRLAVALSLVRGSSSMSKALSSPSEQP